MGKPMLLDPLATRGRLLPRAPSLVLLVSLAQRCSSLGDVLPPVFPVEVRQETEAAAEISWVQAEDNALSCSTICGACDAVCVDDAKVWPEGFSWRCTNGKGQKCTTPVAKAPDLYSLAAERSCGWQADVAAASPSARGCRALGHVAGARRFCPCQVSAGDVGAIVSAPDASEPSSSAPDIEVGSYQCSFKIDDHTRSVFYNGTDITYQVDFGANKWNSTRRVSFMPWPGAYFVVFGQDMNGDFHQSGGFWADCVGAPASQLDQAWEEYCTNSPMDADHLRGYGDGWAKATFNRGGLGWQPGTLGGKSKQYCAFRYVPMSATRYQCDLRVDDYIRKVHYNRVDITSTVGGDLNSWDALRRVSFPPLPGAYLVVYGKDWKGDFYDQGGFWANCDSVPSEALPVGWESYCSATPIDPEHQMGGGDGWQRPSFRKGSHVGWSPGTLGDRNMGHCAFRMMPVKYPATPPPTFAPAVPAEDARPPPPPLPTGWKAVWVEKHQAYYYWEVKTNMTTWRVSEVKAQITQERKNEEAKWNKPCTTQEECLQIVDQYFQAQPRQGNGLLRTYGPQSLGGGDCGEFCKLSEPCPADTVLPGCRYDVYDNAMAAIYLTKRGKLDMAKGILDSFADLLYPTSLDGIAEKLRYVGPSGRTMTLLAAAYSDVGRAKAGSYAGDTVYDGAVDVGNNAWVALAFMHYSEAAHSPDHAAIAKDMLSALTSGSAACKDALGGVRGRLEPYPRNYRSTEHNIDVSALARALGEQDKWDEAHRFVSSMFSRNTNYNASYSIGTGDDGTCDSTEPLGPVPADCTYWNLLADADPDSGRMAAALDFALRSPHPVDPADQPPGEKVDPNYEMTRGLWTQDEDLVHPTGVTLHGTRFTTWGNGIQWEVSASAAMAIVHFSKKYGTLGKADLNQYVEQIRSSLKLLLGMYEGVPGSVLGGNRDAWVQWTFKQDKWRRDVPYPGGSDTGVSWSYLRYNHVASTAWTGLLLLYQAEPGGEVNEDANPLAPPGKKQKQEPGATSERPAATPVAAATTEATTPSTTPVPTTASTSPATTAAPTTTFQASTTEAPTTGASTTKATTTMAPTTEGSTTEASTSTTAPTSTTKPSTTGAPTTSTVAPAKEAGPEFEEWKSWRKISRTTPHPQVEAGSVVKEIKVSHLLGGDMGLQLSDDTLTVVGFTSKLAQDLGWRMGDRLVAMDGNVLQGSPDLDNKLNVLKQVKGGLPVSVMAVRMDLCGSSCWDVVKIAKKACDTTWQDLCPRTSPRSPVKPMSPLSVICPTECGKNDATGPWTHIASPGTELILIESHAIGWQSGRITPLVAQDFDTPHHKYATNFRGKMFYGRFFSNETLRWSDGDTWVRIAGAVTSGDSVVKGPWQCHDYSGKQGDDPEWCRSIGWQDGFEFRFFGPESQCDGCWCCKRKAPKFAAANAMSTGHLTYQERDFTFWKEQHEAAADQEYLDWRHFAETARRGSVEDSSEQKFLLRHDGRGPGGETAASPQAPPPLSSAVMTAAFVSIVVAAHVTVVLAIWRSRGLRRDTGRRRLMRSWHEHWFSRISSEPLAEFPCE
mmetsp:Transcript_70117/g.203323  ORF Transcript_70117/g.203323 Transcript_70117/m.203323 type:complete len:1560 (+) Transcript_70117:48-4727(+)